MNEMGLQLQEHYIVLPYCEMRFSVGGTISFYQGRTYVIIVQPLFKVGKKRKTQEEHLYVRFV